MTATVAQPVLPVIQQHADDAVALRRVRSTLVNAPHVKLKHLARLDERIAAHLDGLSIAGEHGLALCMESLERPGVGEVFATTVRAIEDRNYSLLRKMFALAEAIPEAQRGLLSAFGWVSSRDLQGVGVSLLSSSSEFARRMGIATCTMHGADPGKHLDDLIDSEYAATRGQALRCAGEVGRRDLLPACQAHLHDQDAACRFHAARSAVLLGDRNQSISILGEFAARKGQFQAAALALAVWAGTPDVIHAWLADWSAGGIDLRLLIRGVGYAGNSGHIEAIIERMTEEKYSRIAGEAFSFITGADLSLLDLDRKPPESMTVGPNDNANDADVGMDADEGAPWPDPEKISAWWAANMSRFRPKQRYFAGAVPTWEHCLYVLKEGYQRQRICAAHYLCLMRPGTRLFNCNAPSRRQSRQLSSPAYATR